MLMLMIDYREVELSAGPITLKGMPNGTEGPVVKATRLPGRISRKGAETQRRESH
jgi:hypothetical protein